MDADRDAAAGSSGGDDGDEGGAIGVGRGLYGDDDVLSHVDTGIGDVGKHGEGVVLTHFLALGHFQQGHEIGFGDQGGDVDVIDLVGVGRDMAEEGVVCRIGLGLAGG